METKHPIRAVAARTGLSTHLIRIWERRYEAVKPGRSASGQRLYSDEDINRLSLLRRATEAGESISQIAGMSDEALESLVTSVAPPKPASPRAVSPGGRSLRTPEEFVAACMDAIRKLDARGLDDTLARASMSFNQLALLERVVNPLLQRLGDEWAHGTMRIVHEHLASAAIRSFLGSMVTGVQQPNSAPRLIATTPAGQLHECGALMAVISARNEGWNATYLGPNLPAEDIASAARQEDALVILLSIVYPGDDPHVDAELRKLRRLVGDKTTIIAGGRSAQAYEQAIASARVLAVQDLSELREKLAGVRRGLSDTREGAFPTDQGKHEG